MEGTKPPAGRHLTWARVGALWQTQMVRSDRYPRFLVSLAFLLTFLLVRGITHAMKDRQPPVRRLMRKDSGLQIGDLHIHHLVGGILLLLLTGYLAIGFDRPRWRNRLAVLYGIGAALTLDEFALWLNLENVYWARQGRESVDAGIVTGTVFVLAALGRPFWQALGQEWGAGSLRSRAGGRPYLPAIGG